MSSIPEMVKEAIMRGIKPSDVTHPQDLHSSLFAMLNGHTSFLSPIRGFDLRRDELWPAMREEGA